MEAVEARSLRIRLSMPTEEIRTGRDGLVEAGCGLSGASTVCRSPGSDCPPEVSAGRVTAGDAASSGGVALNEGSGVSGDCGRAAFCGELRLATDCPSSRLTL
jgi:hypothetical protein